MVIGVGSAKLKCRARAEHNLELARHDFKLPPLLEHEEIESILGKLDGLISWASDIKEYALQAAIGDRQWDGWKLVEGCSNRRYIDEATVVEVVTAAGFDPYERKLLGITAMSNLLGKKRFEEVLGGFIEKPHGKPTLVLDNDKRPAIQTAQQDFYENSGGTSHVQ
ncbi:DUF2800 domain-containing protein [Paenibacillus sp. FSL R10-2791]|uniref:DUF2800 domain-containing protein n=1 Tax=unclassified Paenibacillus TaxID=185978 RepID=UPI0030F63F18